MAEAAERPTSQRGEAQDDDELRRYLKEGSRYTSSFDDDDERRSSGGLQLGSIPWKVGLLLIAGVAVLGWLVMRFGVNPGESIHRIRHYPAEFKDREVVLRGRVGDVFELGGSYA